MARFEDNYYKRTQKSREDAENKRLNYAMRGREKVFGPFPPIIEARKKQEKAKAIAKS